MKIGDYEVHDAARLFPLMVGAEFEALCDNLRDQGLLEDIVLVKTGKSEKLLDGRNRLRACEATGIEPRFTHFEGKDPVAYVVSHNLHRRHLDASQRAMVAARIKPLFEAEAAQRLREGGARGGKASGSAPGKNKPVETLPQASERRPPARDQAARLVNVSGRTVQKAQKVIEYGSKELAAAVDAGVVNVELAAQIADKPKDEQKELVRKIAESPGKNARAVLRSHDRDTVVEQIEAEAVEMPEGPFRVILVDFPWAYAKRAGDGTQRGQTLYPTMQHDEIVEFARDKLAPLAHEDAVLFLCITNAHLVRGDHVAVLEASGFTGKTMLSWDKERMGTGDWLRGQTEHIIMATRGRPMVKLTNQSTVLPMISEKRREHSRKPESLYGFIEELCPGNRVELFSRTDRPGWTAWGAEAGSFEAELGL